MNLPDIINEPWIAIVANPYSGSESNRRRVGKLLAELEARGHVAHTMWEPAERAEVLGNAEAMRHCRCIVAAGGDGTLDSVINETLDTPVAAMPLGNESLFAKYFGFHHSAGIADAIDRNKLRTIDLCEAGDRLFAIMAGVGFDADVVRRVERWRVRDQALRRVTRLSYALPIAASVFGYRYPAIELVDDGQTHRGAHAIVFNFNRYAMSLPFAPDAKPDDGKLHWVLFEKPGMLRLGRYMAAVAMGARHLKRDDVKFGCAAEVELRSDRSAAVQIDGDSAGQTPIGLKVRPAALRVIDTR